MGCTCLGGRTPSSRSHFIVDADWVEYVHDASGVQAFVGQLAGEFGECRVREALREHVVSHAAFDVDFLYVDDGVLVHKPAGDGTVRILTVCVCVSHGMIGVGERGVLAGSLHGVLWPHDCCPCRWG